MCVSITIIIIIIISSSSGSSRSFTPGLHNKIPA